MKISNLVGIIADDLTGANDTALQFKKCDAKTKILLDYTIPAENDSNTEIWAVSTESRNVDAKEAGRRMIETIANLNKNLNLEYFYKKIDSTLRGNIAVETLVMVETLGYDAAVIMPAFPAEGRITVGGYHLSRGVPISKTEMAGDPHSPITESYIPALLQSQLSDDNKDMVGLIGLKTVLNGAGPIFMKLKELIKQGKKLIVADASSMTDIEQIVLAINKSSNKILLAGTAATGSILAKEWVPETPDIANADGICGAVVPKSPRLIISGSATKINSEQIEQLEKSYDYDNICSIPLSAENIINGIDDNLVEKIISNLDANNTVVVHSSKLMDSFDGFSDDSLKEEWTRAKFSSKITDFLAELTKTILDKRQVILITLGGETSYKCCKAISSDELIMKDEVAPAIALCVDGKNRWIITKSGNLGKPKTLIDILNYLDEHEDSEGLS